MTQPLIDKLLIQAIEVHRSGNLQEAERLYRRILETDPRHSDANHNLGVLAVSVNKPEIAVPLFLVAIDSKSSVEQYWQSYINVLARLNRVDDAMRAIAQAREHRFPEETLERWLRGIHQSNKEAQPETGYTDERQVRNSPRQTLHDPDNHNAPPTQNSPSVKSLKKLMATYERGRLQEAERQATNLSERFPEHPFAWKMLGAVYGRAGRHAEAIEANRRVLAIDQQDFEALSNLGSALKQCGHLAEAELYLKKATDISPRFAEAHYNLGACFAAQGKNTLAEASYLDAIREDSRLHRAHFNLGVVVQNLGRYEEAEASYRQATKLKPDYEAAFAGLATLQSLMGKLEESRANFTRAIEIKPDFPEAFLGLGVTLKLLKNFDEAEIAFKKALDLRSNYAEASAHLGNLYSEKGQLISAAKYFETAVEIKPDFAEAFCNYGTVLRQLNRLQEAEASYRKSLEIKPKFPDALTNLGVVLGDLEDFKAAMSAFEESIKLSPRLVLGWSNGASTLERWNKLDELEAWLCRAAKWFDETPADLKYFQAKLLFRKRLIEDASAELDQIDDAAVSEQVKIELWSLKASCANSLGEYQTAYNCFQTMNSLVKNTGEYQRSNPDHYFNSAANQLANLRSSSKAQPSSHVFDDGLLTPVFLVGFPRSGTTLLDTILRSHSNIEVVEEKPMVLTARSHLQKNKEMNFIDPMLAVDQVREARRIYKDVLDKSISTVESTTVLIDKLPLNILHVPLIHQLFPDAKFILALRHPFDATLSCWMQNFKINDAMANLVDLDRIMEMYCVAMETFRICREVYALNVHEITYENLLSNIESETTGLLRFLNVDWEPQMANFRETALARGRINTPSYAQVVQPIYQDAKYRWVNYQSQLRCYQDAIGPWVEVFGYPGIPDSILRG